MTDREMLDYLMADELLHIDMIETLNWGGAKVLAASPKGVLAEVRGHWMLTADDEATALALCDEATGGLEQVISVLLHQAAYAPAVAACYGLENLMTVYQGGLLQPRPMPEPPQGIEVRGIGLEYLPLVAAHYDIEDEAYLRDRFDEGVMLGAFIDGACAGFIGEHIEHSCGLLHVLPEHRRKGVGRALTIALYNRRMAQNHRPFGQVEAGNTASFALQKQFGITMSEKPMAWLIKKDALAMK